MSKKKYAALTHGSTYTGIFDLQEYSYQKLVTNNVGYHCKCFMDYQQALAWFSAHGGKVKNKKPVNKVPNGDFRVVTSGNKLGVFDCQQKTERIAFQASISHYPNFCYRRFSTKKEAEAYFKEKTAPDDERPFLQVHHTSPPKPELKPVCTLNTLIEQGNTFSLFPLDAGVPLPHAEVSDNPMQIPQIKDLAPQREEKADRLAGLRFTLMQATGLTTQIFLPDKLDTEYLVFTDAAFNLHSTGKAGLGIVVLADRKVLARLSVPIQGKWLKDSRIAEYVAILCGVLLFSQPARISLFSDCLPCISLLKKGDRLKGVPAFYVAPTLFACHTLHADYIRGHAGFVFNEECDILAKMALNQIAVRDKNLHLQLQARLACYRPLEEQYRKACFPQKSLIRVRSPVLSKTTFAEKEVVEQISLF